MTTLPTPDTLRERAEAALARANTHALAGTAGDRTLAPNTEGAASLATYARELLTIAAMLSAAPSAATPAEVSPPDDHEPARGDVYEYAGAHYAVSFPDDGLVVLVAVEAPSDRCTVTADFVRRFCLRVSPPREASR